MLTPYESSKVPTQSKNGVNKRGEECDECEDYALNHLDRAVNEGEDRVYEAGDDAANTTKKVFKDSHYEKMQEVTLRVVLSRVIGTKSDLQRPARIEVFEGASSMTSCC